MTNQVAQQQSVSLTVDVALQQAIAHHTAGQLQEAERLYRTILQSQPNHPDANHNLGVLAVQVQQLAAALPHLKAALDANPNQGQYWLSYIDALILSGQIGVAREMLEKGRQGGLQGTAVEALAERIEDGVSVIGKATAQDPHTPCEALPATSAIPQKSKANTKRTKLAKSARNPAPPGAESPDPKELNALVALFNKGLYSEMANLAQTLTVRFPLHGFGWKMLGVALSSVGRAEDALIPMQQAVALLPKDPETHCNLGNAQINLGQVAAAVASYRHALKIKPDLALVHSNLGNALKDLGQLDAAVASYRSALKIKHDYAEAHNNLGNALTDLGLLDAAVASCRQALKIKHDYAEAHNNLGNALRGLGLLDESEASYRRALEIKPDYAEASINLGMNLLFMGNFGEGLRRYESRFDLKLKKRQSFQPEVTFPQWQGESLLGKSLLIWWEQGLGDQIQFCRYLPIMRSLGARRIILVCSTPLKFLLQRFDGADEVLAVSEAGNIPIHDYWVFPLSLPLHSKTTKENIPASIPYLYADKELQYEISGQLETFSEFKVGICWQGGKTYIRDAERSPGLEPFKTLFSIGNARFFTLQPSSRAEFLSTAGSVAFDLGHEIDALTPPFEETAALIMNLDLVITSDTSIAHLAGALGKPVWIVLPFVPDWRWMMDREDSPWYPNARLFRQRSRGDWYELFERVAQRLKSVIAGESEAVWPIVNPQ